MHCTLYDHTALQYDAVHYPESTLEYCSAPHFRLLPTRAIPVPITTLLSVPSRNNQSAQLKDLVHKICGIFDKDTNLPAQAIFKKELYQGLLGLVLEHMSQD